MVLTLGKECNDEEHEKELKMQMTPQQARKLKGLLHGLMLCKFGRKPTIGSRHRLVCVSKSNFIHFQYSKSIFCTSSMSLTDHCLSPASIASLTPQLLRLSIGRNLLKTVLTPYLFGTSTWNAATFDHIPP